MAFGRLGHILEEGLMVKFMKEQMKPKREKNDTYGKALSGPSYLRDFDSDSLLGV